jgi:hypothetical protein
MWRAGLIAALLTIVAPIAAAAAPITYTITASSESGTLNGADFTNVPVTLIGEGDTANAGTIVSGEPYVPLSSLTIMISGFSPVTSTDTTQFYVNQLGELVSFNDETLSQDIFDVGAVQFASWGAVSDLGPISVTDEYWGKTDTSGGLLVFSSPEPGDPTFQAAIFEAPEPASLAILCSSILMLGWLRWRRSM